MMDHEHDMQGRVNSPYPANSPMDMLYQSANRAERERESHLKQASHHETLMRKHLAEAQKFDAEKVNHIQAIENLKRLAKIDAAEAEARRMAEQTAELERNERMLRGLIVESQSGDPAVEFNYTYGAGRRTGTDG